MRVSTRIEAYSCKAISREKKLFRLIENDILTDLNLNTSKSPPEFYNSIIKSSFGPLDQKNSIKTLWLIIATLNIAFPDHDFSNLNHENFLREENPKLVLANLTSALTHLRSSSGTGGGQDGNGANGGNGNGMGMGIAPAMPLASMGLNLGIGMVTGMGTGSSMGQTGNGSSVGASGSGVGSSKSDNFRGYSSSVPTNAQSHGHGHASSSSSSTLTVNPTGSKKGSSSSSIGRGASNSPKANHKTLPSTSEVKTGPNTRKGRSGSTSASAIAIPDKGTSANTSSGHSNSKKKQTPPMSHITLVSKLRNDLDGSYDVPTHPLLRQVLDPIIDLSECEVYSYTPDLDSDPHAYQSDEEEEDDEDEEDGDSEDNYGEGGGYDDAPDMDFDETDYTESIQGNNEPGLNAVERMAEQHGWDMNMDGVVEGAPSSSVPGTPKQAEGNGNGTASRPTSQHKKRLGGNGNAPSSSSKKNKFKSSRTTSISGGKEEKTNGGNNNNNSIFANSTRGAIFQYGSLDDYHFGGHHQDPQQEQEAHRGTNRGRSIGGGGSMAEEDEDNGGLLWSSNYFFYNKKMKRILFVSCWGRKIGKQFSPSNSILARGSAGGFGGGIGSGVGHGNPLNAYRKQQQEYQHQYQEQQHLLNQSNIASSKHGKVTINLNRASSHGLGSNSNEQSFGIDENRHDGQPLLQSRGKGTVTGSSSSSSALTNAIRAGSSIQPGTTITDNTAKSFSSPPPIKNASTVFPSSPFPRLDNRRDNDMPPMIRESSNSSTNNSSNNNINNNTSASKSTQMQQQNSGTAMTPATPTTGTRKSAARGSHSHRPNKRRAAAGVAGTGNEIGNASPDVGSPASTVAARRRSVVGQ